MRSFGETLRCCIENQNISINSISKLTGINRGWLYNVFSGERNLPEDKFQILLQKIFFTKSNEELLRESYYTMLYGYSEYRNIRKIIKFFNETYRESCNVGTFSDDTFTLPLTNICPVSKGNIASALRYIIYNEVERSFKPIIYTNHPYNLKSVDNCFYSVLHGKDNNILLNHMIRFERKSNTKNNLDNILHSLRYLKLRQNVHYYYSENFSTEISGIIYPYFVITATGALLFDAAGSQGLFIHNEPDTLSELCKRADNLISKCTPLASFPENILELKDLVEPVAYKGVSSYLQYYPCWAQFVNSALLGEIMHPELPFRDSIIQIAERYYSSIMSNNPLHFFCLSGVADFVNNGRFFEAPEDVVPKLSYSMRVNMLETMIAHIEGPDDNFFLLDERVVSIPQNLEISYCEDCVTLFTTISDGPESYVGECVVHLEDKSIAADFRNFQDYIVRNGFVHTKEYALRNLSDLLVICKELAAGQKAD